jgi:hypothetical protein
VGGKDITKQLKAIIYRYALVRIFLTGTKLCLTAVSTIGYKLLLAFTLLYVRSAY